ncbi:hypothetical protein BTA51_08275 [Hahella sp. CCB-MM4]|nr:hypothetical protein BTA51_08275 [Hahella sp. CCB-MM4]
MAVSQQNRVGSGSIEGTSTLPLVPKRINHNSVRLVKVDKKGAEKANDLRGGKVDAGTKKYQGLNKTNQALRWISSVALLGNKDSGFIEVQATVHNGKLLISSNKNTDGLLTALKSSFQNLEQLVANTREQVKNAKEPSPSNANESLSDRPPINNNKLREQERLIRHGEKILGKLLNEEEFSSFKNQAIEQTQSLQSGALGANVNDQELQTLKEQVDSILDVIRNAAQELRKGDEKGIEKYVEIVDSQIHPKSEKSNLPGIRKDPAKRSACMHAEQSLYDHIVKSSSGEGKSSDTVRPTLVPVAGVKRPCAVCDHVEQTAINQPDSSFGGKGDFKLHRSSERPGILFSGIQGISTGAVGDNNVDSTIESLNSNNIRAADKPVINGSMDTDSESDGENIPGTSKRPA